jgi:hypothetical protein
LEVTALPEAELIDEDMLVKGRELFQTFMYVFAGRG